MVCRYFVMREPEPLYGKFREKRYNCLVRHSFFWWRSSCKAEISHIFEQRLHGAVRFDRRASQLILAYKFPTQQNYGRAQKN